MFNLNILLISATIMMSLTLTRSGDIVKAGVNYCGPDSLGSNMPNSPLDCKGSTNLKAGWRCCYVSVNIAAFPQSNTPARTEKFCHHFSNEMNDNAAQDYVRRNIYSSYDFNFEEFACPSDASTTTTQPTTNLAVFKPAKNSCYPDSLGIDGTPIGPVDCKDATNINAGNRCCYVSVSMAANAALNTPATWSKYCMPFSKDISVDSAKASIAAATTGSGITVNDFSCASAFVKVSSFLIAIMALLL